MLPPSFASACNEDPCDGVDFVVFEHGKEISRSSHDLDQLQDYTDKELVQFVLREFKGSGVEH